MVRVPPQPSQPHHKHSIRRSPSTCGTHEDSSFWLNTDFCGIVCACVTYFLLIYAEYVIVTVVINPWLSWEEGRGRVHLILFSSCICLAIYSHLRAMFTDPGSVPKDALPVDYDSSETNKTLTNQNKPNFRTCMKCNSFKPNRTHHCSICDRCIIKMDHHCPWINNCVGIGNHKFFLLFLFYVFSASAYAIALIATRFAYCVTHSRFRGAHSRYKTIPVENEQDLDPLCENTSPVEHAMMFSVVIEAILFGLFTLCMMCDQSSVVLSSLTQIDRYKSMHASYNGTSQNGKRKSDVFASLAEVFGISPILCWLCPTSVMHKDKERILGYRLINVEKYRDVEGIGEDEVEIELEAVNGTGDHDFDLEKQALLKSSQ